MIPQYFAGSIADSMSESDGIIIMLFLLTIFVLPVYLIVLIAGRVLRNKLVIHPILKRIVIGSLPVTYIALYLFSLFASKDPGQDSGLFPVFAVFGYGALLAGILTVVVILIQSFIRYIKTK